MEYKTLPTNDPSYPSRIVRHFGVDAPKLSYHGPLDFLNRFTIGVLSADSAAGDAFIAMNELLFVVRELDINYIGPWHSILETEIFRLALYRNRPLTLFTAKGLEVETFDSFLLDRFYPPLDKFPEKEEYLRRSKDRELLVLSASHPKEKRQLRQNIIQRNLLTCALSDVIFIPFAEKGTKTYSVVKKVISFGIPMFTSDIPQNKSLYELGVAKQTRKTLQPYLDNLVASRGNKAGSAVTVREPNSAYKLEDSVSKQHLLDI